MLLAQKQKKSSNIYNQLVPLSSGHFFPHLRLWKYSRALKNESCIFMREPCISFRTHTHTRARSHTHTHTHTHRQHTWHETKVRKCVCARTRMMCPNRDTHPTPTNMPCICAKKRDGYSVSMAFRSPDQPPQKSRRRIFVVHEGDNNRSLRLKLRSRAPSRCASVQIGQKAQIRSVI